MHAMFAVSEIDASRWDEAEAMLKNGVAPQIKQSPGFVSGTWTRSADGQEGRSIVLFETEDAARAVMESLSERMPADGPVKIAFAGVFEVVHQV